MLQKMIFFVRGHTFGHTKKFFDDIVAFSKPKGSARTIYLLNEE